MSQSFFPHRRVFPGLSLMFIVGSWFLFDPPESMAASKWVGTWACAPYAAGTNTPPAPYLENNTLRQIVRCSIGGDTLRVKFSNITAATPVTLNSVSIAVQAQTGGSAIDLATLKQLQFNGSASVTMAAYAEVISDPVAFPLTPGMNLTISIHYGQCKTASDMTHHYGSRTDSYLLAGDQTQAATFGGAVVIERWYTIATIDVLMPDSAAAVAVLGNSITDGYGLHGGPNNKWTDKFSERLLANPATAQVGVLNLGIGATLLTTSGVGRFQHDILDQSGLRWIIVFYGVNDINAGLSANDIINACKNLIAQAHAHSVRIYGATITPFKGHSYYSTAHEAVRKEVNQWISTPGNFDRWIDFDKALRDPADAEKLQAAYSNDWLHPNAEGYKLLGASVDLNLFVGGDTTFAQADYETHFFEPECAIVGGNWEIQTDALASHGQYVMVKTGTQSLNEAPAGAESVIAVPFSIDTVGNYTMYARLNCPTYNDDSYWVKMDDGQFQMYNGLVTSGWEWKKFNTYALITGDHTLTVAYREDGAKLDKICISNADSAPTGMGEDAENLCDPTGFRHSIAKPEGYALEQNYPNPFNPTTTIRFTLPHAEKVTMSIFNNRGQLISNLHAGRLNEGSHQFVWNACDLSSGIYFCRVYLERDRIYSRRMLLIK